MIRDSSIGYFSQILLTSSMSVDRIVRRDAVILSPYANSFADRSFNMMPKLFNAMIANMKMHNENFEWGERPRCMKTIFWSESEESLLCGEPGAGEVVCEIE